MATEDAEAKATGGGDGGRWRWRREEAMAMEGDRRRATMETTDDGHRAADGGRRATGHGDDDHKAADHAEAKTTERAKRKRKRKQGDGRLFLLLLLRCSRLLSCCLVVLFLCRLRRARWWVMRDGAVSAVRISNFKNEQPSKNFEIQVLAYDIVFEVAKNVNPRESPCPRVQISNLCDSYSLWGRDFELE